MNIIIIGGSGFIGTRLAKRLEVAGHQFRIIDLEISRSFPGKTIRADVTNYGSIMEAMKRALQQFTSSSQVEPHTGEDTVLYNLAAAHRDDLRPRSLYYRVNVDGTAHICRSCRQLGIIRQIFTSSVAVYGLARPDCGEDGAIEPFSHYGKSKVEAEKVYQEWLSESREHGLTIVRPTVVFGEGNRGNVYNLMRQIAMGPFFMIGSGRNHKSVAYVENLAAFLEYAMIFGKGNRLYNYVDKPDYCMNEMVRLIHSRIYGGNRRIMRIPYLVAWLAGTFLDLLSRVTGLRFPVSAVRVMKFCAETRFSSAAHNVEGFRAPVDMEQCWQRTLDYEFKEERNPKDELFYTE